MTSTNTHICVCKSKANPYRLQVQLLQCFGEKTITKLNAFQDYVPSRADCPGYDIPLEKTPRQIDSGLDSDNYYPSGERRPAQGEMTQIK